MNWKKLFDMQEKLDSYIKENHGVQDTELLEKKILALLVEVGELANETRCFKFWSTKQPSEKEVILEEYVDGIHFLLSIGLEKNYFFTAIEPNNKTVTLTKQFNYVFTLILNFKDNQNEKSYIEMFTEYIKLGNLLGFSSEDIYAAYIEKNDVNHQRQNSGY